MKKILALLTAAALLLCVSCGDTTPETTSSEGKKETSSTVSEEAGKEYEKPEEITREGTEIGVFEGEQTAANIAPDFIESVNSLDAYTCSAVAVDDSTVALFYTYSVSTMPNYYEPRLAVGLVKKNEDGSLAAEGGVKTTEVEGYMNRYLVSGGYVAVASDSKNIRIYALTGETFSAEAVASYKGEGVSLLDFAVSGDVFYPLYTDGDGVCLGERKLTCSMKNPTVGAVAQDGTLVGLSDGDTGVVLNAQTGKTLQENLDLSKLDDRVSVYASAKQVLFLGKVAGGNTSLTAVTVTAAGESASFENLFDDRFADTYARGCVAEGDDGKLYLISSRTPSNFAFGDAEVCEIADDMTLSAPLYTLAKGWHPYFVYTFGNTFALTENLAEGTNITDYVHLF